MQFKPNTAFKFIKEKFGEIITCIKSKNIFKGNMLTKIELEYNLNLFIWKACEKGLLDDVKFYILNVNTKKKYGDGESPLIIGKWIF